MTPFRLLVCFSRLGHTTFKSACCHYLPLPATGARRERWCLRPAPRRLLTHSHSSHQQAGQAQRVTHASGSAALPHERRTHVNSHPGRHMTTPTAVTAGLHHRPVTSYSTAAAPCTPAPSTAALSISVSCRHTPGGNMRSVTTKWFIVSPFSSCPRERDMFSRAGCTSSRWRWLGPPVSALAGPRTASSAAGRAPPPGV